jgi:hypothetical protein
METRTYYLNEVTLDYNKRLFTTKKISRSEDAASVAREMYKHSNCNLDLKEYFFVIFLNKAQIKFKKYNTIGNVFLVNLWFFELIYKS